MFKRLKILFFGEPIKGEKLKEPKIHHIVMPCNIDFSVWVDGYWNTFTNNIKF